MSVYSIVLRRILAVLVCASMLVGPFSAAPAAAAPPVPEPEPAPLIDRVRPDVFQGQFRLAGTAEAGKRVELIFSIDPIADVPDVSIRLIVPEGVVVISGSTAWQGSVRAGQRIERRFTLSVPEAGEWDVRAAVESPGEPALSRVYVTYINRAAGEADLSTSAAHAASTPAKAVARLEGARGAVPDTPVLAPGARPAELEAPAPAAAAAAATTGTATITGRLSYDNDFGSRKPVRDSVVQLIQADIGRAVATARTDNSGNFTLRAKITGPKDVFVVFWCENTASIGVDPSGWVWYGTTNLAVARPGSTTNIGWWYFNYQWDCFEAIDYALDEYRWVASKGGGWKRSQVAIVWPTTPDNDGVCGGWPCSTGDSILLPYQSVYPWWDRPTVLHEYAHTVMYTAYDNSWPFGCYMSSHYINSESCEGFALTEGFAEFMESAVDNNPANTLGISCAGKLNNIESNDWHLGLDCVANNSGAIVEGAVASILWDIFDAHNRINGDTDRDSLTLGFDEIWRILRTYKPQGINAFYDEWFLHYGSKSQMNTIFSDHGVDKLASCLSGDAGGSFASATSLAVPADKEGYICPAWDDEDWYRLAVFRGEVINASLSSLPGDYDLVLYRPDGSEAAGSRNAGTSPELISYTVDADGEWRLQIYGFNGASSSTDSYLLRVDIGGCDCGANGVVLYTRPSYNGFCVTLTDSQPSLASIGFDNRAASIRFVGRYAGDWEAVLYDSANYAGTSKLFNADDLDLANDAIKRGRASSVRVRLRTPPTPTGLRASDDTDSSRVQINWDTTPRAESYLVYRYTSNSRSYAKQIGTTTGNFFYDVDAYPGKTYWYWVRAKNGTGTSGYSTADSGRRLLVPPPAPADVAASDGKYGDRVQISWTAAWTATKYWVLRNTADDSAGAELIGSTTGTSYADTKAAKATVYWYWVLPENKAGTSSLSAGDSGYRKQAVPTSVSASDGSYSDKVRVSWTAASGATSYTVYRHTANASAEAVEMDTVVASPYEDTTAVPGITYYYWVKAHNAAYSSALSASNSGYRKLLAPANVSASDDTFTDKVQIRWAASEGAESYLVYRYTSNSRSYAKQIGTTTGTSFDDTDAYPGKTYWYWVRAKNSARTSGYSTVDSGRRLLVPPAAPENVAASDGTYGDRVQLSWTAAWTATKYYIYRNTVNDSGAAALLGSTSSTSYSDSKTNKGTVYWYWVIAENQAGQSGYSTGDSGYRKQAAPGSVNASDGSFGEKVRVTWTAASDATSYTVYRHTANVSAEAASIGSTTALFYEDTSAVPGFTYYYWVKANNDAYSSAFSTSNSGYRKLLAPEGVSASEGIWDKVQITWAPSEGAESYLVYRYTSNSSSNAKQIGTTAGTTFDDTTATPGKTYWYWVRAKNSARTSGYSTADSGQRLPF